LLAAVATSGVMARTRAVVRLAFFPISLCSGAIFPVSALPQGARDVLLLNPVLHLLDSLRSAFFGDAYRATPSSSLWLPAAWLLATTAMSLSLYRLRRDRLQPL
jgi:capsular polysaccharide transport system permease protein